MPDSVNPYLPPAEDTEAPLERGRDDDPSGVAFRDGPALVVELNTRFPKICLKCASRDVFRRREQAFQYIPRWVIFVFLLCNIAGIIAMLASRKSAKLELPLCSSCDARFTQARQASIIGVVGLIAVIIGPLLLEEPQLMLMGLVVGLVGFLVLIFGFVRPRMIQATMITAETITLTGIHSDAIDRIIKRAAKRTRRTQRTDDDYDSRIDAELERL